LKSFFSSQLFGFCNLQMADQADLLRETARLKLLAEKAEEKAAEESRLRQVAQEKAAEEERLRHEEARLRREAEEREKGEPF